jgi:hypothetical protein
VGVGTRTLVVGEPPAVGVTDPDTASRGKPRLARCSSPTVDGCGGRVLGVRVASALVGASDEVTCQASPPVASVIAATTASVPGWRSRRRTGVHQLPAPGRPEL